MDSDHYDVIIVGGGVAASVAAYNLSLANLNIACFEQGDFERNSSDFKTKNLNFLNYKKLNINPNLRKSKYDYSINDKNSEISIANFNGVGGSSVLYSAHLPRFMSDDFGNRQLKKKTDWPLNYNSLKNYYAKNEKILGVAGLQGDPSYPDKIKNLLPPVDFGPAICKVASAFKKLNWHWWPSYSGVITKKIDKRRIGTISEPNNSYWPKALKNKVKLFTKSKVLKIISKDKKKVSSVIYSDENKVVRQKFAKIIILACSGIGTPRLLLNSSNKYYPKGLANSSGLVGKNLMLHPLAWVEGTFEDFLKSYSGPQGCSIYSTQFHKVKNLNRGYTIQILREALPVEHFVMRKKLGQLNFGKNFFDDVYNYYGKTVSAAIICEDLPELKNMVSLDYNNIDNDGMPNVKLQYSVSKNSKKLMSHGIKNCTKLLIEAGAKKIISFGPVKHTGWHIMGTAKMGKNKTNSVVNQNGQCHDIQNLFIVDSSIFCSSSGMNIVSTICALSLKISDFIKKKIKNEK